MVKEEPGLGQPESVFEGPSGSLTDSTHLSNSVRSGPDFFLGWIMMEFVLAVVNCRRARVECGGDGGGDEHSRVQNKQNGQSPKDSSWSYQRSQDDGFTH